MLNHAAIEKILSKERFSPYLFKHDNCLGRAVMHYKANIQISESFYSGISILEVGLRNNIERQFKQKYKSEFWFEDDHYLNDVTGFQIDRILDARKIIQQAGKAIPQVD